MDVLLDGGIDGFLRLLNCFNHLGNWLGFLNNWRLLDLGDWLRLLNKWNLPTVINLNLNRWLDLGVKNSRRSINCCKRALSLSILLTKRCC